MARKHSQDEQRLTRRYLIWCYKTTKEEIDCIDRYFTQFEVDQFLLKELKKEKGSPDYNTKVQEFTAYLHKKHEAALNKKFISGKDIALNPAYQYLSTRLKAIEKAIIHFLGKPALMKIVDLYEDEMTKRILESREH